jgi:hypothetical protein
MGLEASKRQKCNKAVQCRVGAALGVLERQVDRGEMLEGDRGRRAAAKHRERLGRRARKEQLRRADIAAGLHERGDRGGVDGRDAVEVEQ